jgi:hypothetical protein
MSLLDVRKEVIKFSGRLDLVEDDSCVVDKGVDTFIRTASRVLDMRGDQDRSLKYWTGSIGANTCRIMLQDCRMVFKVWWQNSDGAWTQLDPKGFDEFLENYSKLSETTASTPLYWAREPIHRDPRNQGASPLMAAMGIMLMPPTDEDIAIKVFGKFYEKTLIANEDVNYWTEEHPLLLVYASLYEMETTYRSTQGATDWKNRVDDYLIDIDRDLAEAADKYPMEMEG